MKQLRHNSLQVPMGSQYSRQDCPNRRAHQLAEQDPTPIAKSSRRMRLVKRWKEQTVASKLPYLVRQMRTISVASAHVLSKYEAQLCMSHVL